MGGIKDVPFGVATSVGPLPCDDPTEAVRMALRAQPEFPSSPTLATTQGSLLAQAVAGVSGVGVVPPGLLQVDPELCRTDPAADPSVIDPSVIDPRSVARGVDSLCGEAWTVFHEFVDQLAVPPAAGVRVNVLGPVTLALGLRAAGVPTGRAMAMARCIVSRRAAAVLDAVRNTMPEGVVFVCASEPGMIGAVHPTFPLGPDQVLELLTPFVDALDRHPAAGELMIGVHVPGQTDWETIIASGISVVSAPAEPGLVGWAGELSGFLDRGGRVVWGAVPVDQPLGTGEELLWRRLSAVWCEFVAEGVDPLVLRSRSMIGPVDGLGHFGVTQAERVLDLVDSLATRVRRQAVGARLTLGA